MSESKWYRQDAKERSREWFLFLPVGARLAWRMLKDYVCEAQLSQKRAGVAPALTPRVAAHQWNLAAEDVETMLAAVQAEGLLVATGTEWRITDPQTFQSESAKRMQRHRGGDGDDDWNEGEKNPEEPVTTPHNPSPVTDSADCASQPVTTPQDPSQDVTPVARHLHLQPHTDSSNELSDPATVVADPRSPPIFDLVKATLTLVAEGFVAQGIKADPPTDAKVRKWLPESRNLAPLVRRVGPERAARAFVWCAGHFEGGKSWGVIDDNLAVYESQMEQGISFVPRSIPPSATSPGMAEPPSAPRLVRGSDGSIVTLQEAA